MLIKNIYVVYLTEYLGEKLPRFYIGSSGKENILKGYNGSIGSKKYKDIYKQEQLNNKHLFKTEILFECYDREVALDIEYKFQKLANAVERNDYMNMSYAGGCFGKQNLTTPESIKKGLETKRKNGTFEKDSISIKKTIETKRKNGTLKHSEETKKKISNLKRGVKQNPETVKKRLNTILHEDESGKSIAKSNGIKMSETRKNKTNEEGLNDYQVMSINQSKLMNSVLDSGITEAKRRGLLTSKTKKEIGSSAGANNSHAKRINIYNSNDELMFECFGNFEKTCSENNLPFKALRRSYIDNSRRIYSTCLPNNKEFIPYTNWYAKEIK